MRIIIDIDNEQNLIDLWNPEKNKWERYIKCEEEDKKIEKLPPSFYENACLTQQDRDIAKKINEIIDKINKMEDK